jgi:hypothetical protein
MLIFFPTVWPILTTYGNKIYILYLTKACNVKSSVSPKKYRLFLWWWPGLVENAGTNDTVLRYLPLLLNYTEGVMLQKTVMPIHIRQYLPFGDFVRTQQKKGRNKLADSGSALVLQVSFDFTQQVSRKNHFRAHWTVRFSAGVTFVSKILLSTFQLPRHHCTKIACLTGCTVYSLKYIKP